MSTDAPPPALGAIGTLEAQLEKATTNLIGVWSDLRERLERACRPAESQVSATPVDSRPDVPAPRSPQEISLRDKALTPVQRLISEMEDVSRRLEL